MDEIVFYPTSEKKFARLPQILLSYTGNDHYDSVFNDEGVPLKISTSSHKNYELYQMENNNRRIVLNAREYEFRRMRRHFARIRKNFAMHPLNTLNNYTTATYATTVTYAMLRATQKQRLREDELKSKGRNLTQILKHAGIHLAYQPNDVWRQLLAPLSHEWPNIYDGGETAEEEENSGKWEKYVFNSLEEPTIRVGFLIPEEHDDRTQGMVFEIRAEEDVASKLAEALENLFDKNIKFVLEKKSVIGAEDG